MNNFYVGQKVVCIDARPGYITNKTGLIKNNIYTIKDIYEVLTRNSLELGCELVEFSKWGWSLKRFRPLIEKKTDISIFTDMLIPNKVVEKV